LNDPFKQKSYVSSSSSIRLRRDIQDSRSRKSARRRLSVPESFGNQALDVKIDKVQYSNRFDSLSVDTFLFFRVRVECGF